MGPVREHRTVVAVSPSDLPLGSQLLVSSCEDCACAVSASPPRVLRPPQQPSDALLACEDDLQEIRLDAEHFLLFNPRVEAGLLVLSSTARAMFEGFRVPTTASDASRYWTASPSDQELLIGKLTRLGMLTVEGLSIPAYYDRIRTLTAWLHVTNDCNLRCSYCYIRKSHDEMSEAVGLAAVERVIESAARHGFSTVKFKYAGGEASLNYSLVCRLHDHARELTRAHGIGLEATLLSNGVALPLRFVDYLWREGLRVMISLDGVGALNDVQRPLLDGRPSFARVDATIHKLLDLELAPHLSVTISRRNMRGIPDVVRYALDRGLTFSLNLFRENDCSATFSDLQYEEAEIIECLLATFDAIEAQLPPWSVLGSVLDRGQLLQPRERSCGVGQDYVVIDQRGRISKCHMEIERTLGDVFICDPLELVRRDTSGVQNFVASEKEGCMDCTWKNWCSGGCSMATLRATGRFDVKSPNCHIYKAIYPLALRLEGLRILKYRPVPGPSAGGTGHAPS